MRFSAKSCPVLINCRDRVNDLRSLVDWLERAGHERIVLVDNDSSWGPLVEYLEQTPHEVLRLDDNYGSRSLWRTGNVPGEYFVLTDPDLIPVEECPLDAVQQLWEALRLWPRPKAAMGLYLDDLPPIQSLPWERSLVAARRRIGEVGGVDIFDSYSDTTFALWQPHSAFTLSALRLGAPLQCRHMPWYRLHKPTEEESYYLSRAIEGPTGSSWKEGRQ